MTRHRPLVAFASAALLSGCAALAQSPVAQGAPNVPDFAPTFPEQTRAPEADSGVLLAVEKIAAGLEHPWGVAVTPDGAVLVTERPGRLRVIAGGALRPEPVAGLPKVFAQKQGGLLDVAVSPDFAEDRTIFWTYAKPVAGGSATAAARGRLSEDLGEVTDVADIFVQTPASASPMHYGARIAFDGAGHVYVTTGERFTPAERVRAQDLDATYGKVVRLRADGSVPSDNPFADRPDAEASVWSFGHRNIQSADVHPETGELWIAEHGPRGGDELNLVARGANYGWPLVSYGENYDGSPVGTGDTTLPNTVQPRYYWDPVIAPGGMLFYEGALFGDWRGDLLISSLNPGALVRLELEGDTVVGEERLLTDAGRIRDIAVDADGSILALVDAPQGSVLRLTPED